MSRFHARTSNLLLWLNIHAKYGVGPVDNSHHPLPAGNNPASKVTTLVIMKRFKGLMGII